MRRKEGRDRKNGERRKVKKEEIRQKNGIGRGKEERSETERRRWNGKRYRKEDREVKKERTEG